MGGIVTLNAIAKIPKEKMNTLKEIIFLNVPLAQHPVAIHK